MKARCGTFPPPAVPENLGLSLDSRSGCAAKAVHVPAGFQALVGVFSGCILHERADVNHVERATHE